jgi:hypothetical protein
MSIFFSTLKFSAAITLAATNFLLSDQSVNAKNSCILTMKDDAICGKNTSKKTGAQLSKQNSDLAVELKECARSNDTNVICEFTITNKGERRSLDIYSLFSEIIDSTGKTHKALYTQLGSSAGVLGASLYEAEPDIAYAASLTFKDVPGKINKIQLLTIGAKLGSQNLSVKIRNISIAS